MSDINDLIKTPEIVPKFHFCLKYFNFLNKKEVIDNLKSFKKIMEVLKSCENKTFNELYGTQKLIPELSIKTISIAEKMIGTNEFKQVYENKVYDLIRGDTKLRIFGVFNPLEHEFCLLQFDFNHDSR